MDAYTTVLWAIALVAALRETSVLFAVLIGFLWFRERRPLHVFSAAAVVVTGIFLLRL